MIVLTALQSIVFLVTTLAVIFFAARVIADAERRQLTSSTEAQVSFEQLMAEPEPATAPRAHLRLVHSGPGLPADEPYDQFKDHAL